MLGFNHHKKGCIHVGEEVVSNHQHRVAFGECEGEGGEYPPDKGIVAIPAGGGGGNHRKISVKHQRGDAFAKRGGGRGGINY